MSGEILNIQSVTSQLKESNSTEKQLRDNLLAAKEKLSSIDQDESADISVVLQEISDDLSSFEAGISGDAPITAELQSSIDKLQSDIATLEQQKNAEQADVVAQGSAEQKGLFDAIFNSADPAKEFTSWRKGLGTKLLGFIGIGSALTAVATQAGGNEAKTKETEGLFAKATNRIKDIFGLNEKNKDTPPEVPTDEESIDIGSVKHKALVQELISSSIDFKNPIESDTSNPTKERLSLLSYQTLVVLKSVGDKFPGIRITSTLRSKYENDQLADSNKESSKHLYGLAFDIGRDLKSPPIYTFESVDTYLRQQFGDKISTLQHGEGENNHLHIETNEPITNKPSFATADDIKRALTASIV